MVTSIEELRNKKYIEIELPGWNAGEKFICKVQRVNILNLASKGKIPNPLMSSVSKVFRNDLPDVNKEGGLKEMCELADLFAENMMVEPTFKEVEEAIGLTDEQRVYFYNFGIRGPEVLESFRRKPESTGTSENGEDIQREA